MGFSDSLKRMAKSLDRTITGGALSSNTKTGTASKIARLGTRMGALANPMFPASATTYYASGDGKSGRTGRALAGAFSPVFVAGERLSESKQQDKVRGFLDGGDGETPPPVAESPGVGSGTSAATQAARRQAVAAAAARRRSSQTVTTTPLGTTQSAATSKKKLLGE